MLYAIYFELNKKKPKTTLFGNIQPSCGTLSMSLIIIKFNSHTFLIIIKTRGVRN
jgi:hypothetical protein